MKKIIWWLILVGILVKLIFYIIANKNYFSSRFDPVYFGNLYSQSQYVIGSSSKGIGDDGLYAFAGYYYLFQGGDVTRVNFEHPPLGKYLIGVSILLFGNENVINIIYFALLLLVTYKIGQLIFNQNLNIYSSSESRLNRDESRSSLKDSSRLRSNNILSLVAVSLLSFDPLFLDHLLRSQLDLPFTLFFVTAVYFFLRGLKEKKYFFLSFLFWGAAFTTRFFPFFVIIYVYLLIVLSLTHRISPGRSRVATHSRWSKGLLEGESGKAWKTFFIASLLVPVIYFISHTTFFIHQPSLIEFLRHKKWMLAWFSGSPVIVGNIWRNIFTGSYTDPTGYSIVSDRHWTPLVPMIIILAICHVELTYIIPNLFRNPVKTLKHVQGDTDVSVRDDKKHRAYFFVIYWLCISYLIYLTFITLGLQKMLMPIYPLLIILAVSNIVSLYSIITSWRRMKQK